MSQESLDEIGSKYIENYQLGKGKEYKGGDKTSLGKGFTKKYEQLFEPLRDQPVELLELGILYGRSIAMWSDYFSKGMIHGLDLSLGPFTRNKSTLDKMGAFKNNNHKLYEYDIRSTKFKDEFIKTCPHFDIIIDDALHQPKQQFDNFMLLFSKLKNGGYYIVEDLVKPIGFFQCFSDLISCVGNPDAKSSIGNRYGSMARKIESIEITANLVIFKKKN